MKNELPPAPQEKPADEKPKLKPRTPTILAKPFEMPDGTLAPKFTPSYIYRLEDGFRVHYEQGGFSRITPYSEANLVHLNALLKESEDGIIQDQADREAAKLQTPDAPIEGAV